MLSPLEKALPKLVEKIYTSGHRVVVICASEAELKEYDTRLWTYTPLAFLPHASALDSDLIPTEQPIWLTTNTDNPNAATVAVVAGLDSKVPITTDGFERIVYVYDGADNKEVAHAQRVREWHQHHKHHLQEWVQTASGWQSQDSRQTL